MRRGSQQEAGEEPTLTEKHTQTREHWNKLSKAAEAAMQKRESLSSQRTPFLKLDKAPPGRQPDGEDGE